MGEPAPSLPELGAVLQGKYRIVRRIGEGGMGVVYEALHLRLRQRVAIKMLLPEMMSIPDVVSRFEREARAAGQLRGENAARVLDVEATQSGIPYMVMEFLDGHDLSQQIVRHGQLPVGEAVDYVLQACNAMREAHRMGIVHRDLKPSNLFLANVEGRQLIKVLDFGISKVEDDREARVTGTQATVGTPLYMSPEQIRSAKHVDARTDIWSLGIILYELLVGKTPYEGSTTAAAVAICIDPVPSVRGVRPDVPVELEAVIMKALAKERDQRYPNVEAFAAAIAPFASTAVPYVSGSHPSLSQLTQSQYPSAPGADDLSSARTEVSDPGRPRAGAATAGSWTTGSGTRKKKSNPLILAGAIGVGLALVIGGVVFVATRAPKTTANPDPSPAKAGISVTAPTVAIAPTATTTEPTIAVSALPPATTVKAPPPATTIGKHPPATATTSVKPPVSATAHPTAPPPTNTGTAAPAHI